uniref:F-box only protein 15-like n=1 Tax=Phallusia mammillata TaxID=59560 RepID=A0A6F9DD79_9ASCI|nr:F-box only protein 15-like [Phallusia mammillata]
MSSSRKAALSTKVKYNLKQLQQQKLSLQKRFIQATVDLPDEMWKEVIGYLDLQSVLTFPCVCKKWRCLVDNETLWQRVFLKHAAISPFTFRIPDSTAGEAKGMSFWKSKCLKYFIGQRNKYYKSKVKKNIYTGTTNNMEQLLKNIGVKFQLGIEDIAGRKHCLKLSYKKVFKSSTLLQWNSLNLFPDWREIKAVKVFGLVPVLYQAYNKPLKSSPLQKSLLTSIVIPKGLQTCCSDEKLSLIRVTSFLCVALWKGSTDVAFVMASLHHHNLIDKLLYGSEERMYSIEHCPILDDIDHKYGLHSYDCHLHLHSSSETIWEEKFTCMGCEIIDKLVQLNVTRFSPFCNSVPSLSWKTDLFHGSLNRVALLDVTVIDCNKVIMWSNSGIVIGESSQQTEVDFDNFTEEFLFTLTDQFGSVEMKYKLTDGNYIITAVKVGIWVKHLNGWFATNY